MYSHSSNWIRCSVFPALAPPASLISSPLTGPLSKPGWQPQGSSPLSSETAAQLSSSCSSERCGVLDSVLPRTKRNMTDDKWSDRLCGKCKECKLLRGVLIEQMGVTGHGFRAGESISQMLLLVHVHSWTLFFEFVNIAAFTNSSFFVFSMSLYIFEG